ncbi:hypothetical protein N9S30_00155 [bacterium]|nr:hypothetical protein [bacterium]
MTPFSSDTALSSKQKLAILHKSGGGAASVDLNKAIAVTDETFTLGYLKEHSCGVCLAVAGLGPLKLHSHHGLETAMDLRELGFDSIDLVRDAKFVGEAIRLLGAQEIVSAFLTSPGDAVMLAGSSAASQLGVTTTALLMTCAGAPVEAKNVLQQLNPRETCLQDVPFSVLADTGVRALALVELGLTSENVKDQLGVTRDQLRLLGFV